MHIYAHHAKHSSCFADSWHEVLVENLIFWWMDLLQLSQSGEHHIKLIPLSKEIRHCQQLEDTQTKKGFVLTV